MVKVFRSVAGRWSPDYGSRCVRCARRSICEGKPLFVVSNVHNESSVGFCADSGVSR